nr:hypothetical protein [Pandoravirus massiliensis]
MRSKRVYCNDLPAEVWEAIVLHLDLRSVLSVASVDRRMRAVVDGARVRMPFALRYTRPLHQLARTGAILGAETISNLIDDAMRCVMWAYVAWSMRDAEEYRAGTQLKDGVIESGADQCLGHAQRYAKSLVRRGMLLFPLFLIFSAAGCGSFGASSFHPISFSLFFLIKDVTMPWCRKKSIVRA